ncbi:MAG: diguanylate cyclase, partial [Acidobacteria bacterium]|nr:diguanylate cyclase [Acidobacteriota bacterium]
RYRELFENASDMVYTLDLDGRITSLNKAAERLTGYSRAEALRMKLVDLVAPDHRDAARSIIQRHLAGEPPATHEIDILTKSGHRLALEISTHLIAREGRPIGLQGIVRDITERKKTEEALQQAKGKLEAWVHELEQRTREMTLLSEMGDMLRACLTTEEAYSVIVRVAQQIFPVQLGALYVITPSRNLVEAVALWGDTSFAERVFAPDDCWALRRGRVHWVEEPAVGLICKHLHQPTQEGYLCVPMMAQSEALGVLHLTQPRDARLTEAKQRLAVAMAEHIAMALSNLRLHETLRSQSIRDPLTGLFNRRFMEESLELELRKAARAQHPLGLIMLELDRNDGFQVHLPRDAENAVLMNLATLLQAQVRKEDIACRFTAEKFTLILPQGSREVVQRRAESLREKVSHLHVRHRSRLFGHLTVSVGASYYPEHGRTVEALLRATDSALHRAKEEGGNRLIMAV